MKRIIVLLFGFILFAVGAQQCRAQSRYTKPNELENDQIIETLDSLVNIKYISRITLKKQPTRSNFQPDDIPVYSDDVIKQRLARLQSPIPLAYNDQVKRYIDLYVNKRRDLSSITLGLTRLYFPMFEQVLDMYGLPLELKYLAVVESALNPVATSRVGATGLWQFMYNTGKIYNLEISSFVDERRDAYKSTIAACQYFKEMYAIYKDWLLVIASYNCGPGNVNKAIIRSGGKTNFWEIAKYLPKETRGYVPAFIAVNYMMNYAAEHNISGIPSVISYLELDTINIKKKLVLNDVASTIGVSAELIRFLNPVYKKGFVPYADKAYKLILPANRVAMFLSNSEILYKGGEAHDLALIPFVTQAAGAVSRRGAKKVIIPASASNNGSSPSVKQLVDVKPVVSAKEIIKDIRKIHIVRRGDNIEKIADFYRCSVEEVKTWNHMKGSKLRNGQRVIIYLTSDTNNKLLTYNNEVQPKNTNGKPEQRGKVRYIYHVVQYGDTLWTIAKKYNGVTVAQLKEINNIHGSKALKPGTKIKVALMT